MEIATANFRELPFQRLSGKYSQRPRWWVLGRAKRQNRVLLSRFLRLAGYRFGTYPDFPDSLSRHLGE